MSHNLHRIPARMRAAAARDMDAKPPKRPPVRKMRRMPREIRKSYAARSAKHRWLETHLWHAKRFRMVDLWGHRIGLHPSDKGTRASLRQAAHCATIHDCSYIRPVLVSGAPAAVAAALRAVLDPDCVSQLAAAQPGSREVSGFLYRRGGYPAAMLCPVRVFVLPLAAAAAASDAVCRVCVWIHAAAYAESLAELRAAAAPTVSVSEQQYARFSVAGARAHAPVRRALAVTDTQTLWSQLAGLRSCASLAPGSVLSLLACPRRTPTTRDAEWGISRDPVAVSRRCGRCACVGPRQRCRSHAVRPRGFRECAPHDQ